MDKENLSPLENFEYSRSHDHNASIDFKDEQFNSTNKRFTLLDMNKVNKQQ